MLKMPNGKVSKCSYTIIYLEQVEIGQALQRACRNVTQVTARVTVKAVSTGPTEEGYVI